MANSQQTSDNKSRISLLYFGKDFFVVWLAMLKGFLESIILNPLILVVLLKGNL